MIDSHCHLADEAFVADLDAVIDRARAAGVYRSLCILDVTKPEEWHRAEKIAVRWPNVRFAVGVHPHQAGQFVDRLDDVEETVRAAVAKQPQARVLGEIGLDYHYDLSAREIQRDVFRRQVWLAREIGWPVVIHTRDANADTVDVLREAGGGEVRGVFHCFTGDAGLARRALDLGFHLSFSGIITFRRTTAIRDAAAIVPGDRLLTETDCPYLAPVPFRGKRNEPAWAAHVVDVLAEVRGQSRNRTVEETTAAFVSLFGD